jgi:hypothetical protein
VGEHQQRDAELRPEFVALAGRQVTDGAGGRPGRVVRGRVAGERLPTDRDGLDQRPALVVGQAGEGELEPPRVVEEGGPRLAGFEPEPALALVQRRPDRQPDQ